MTSLSRPGQDYRKEKVLAPHLPFHLTSSPAGFGVMTLMSGNAGTNGTGDIAAMESWRTDRVVCDAEAWALGRGLKLDWTPCSAWENRSEHQSTMLDGGSVIGMIPLSMSKEPGESCRASGPSPTSCLRCLSQTLSVFMPTAMPSAS